MKFLILNGPNLNLLGSREPGVYGPESYEGLCRRVRDFAAAHGASADCFQSNHEGALIDAIHAARGTYDAIVYRRAGGDGDHRAQHCGALLHG